MIRYRLSSNQINATDGHAYSCLTGFRVFGVVVRIDVAVQNCSQMFICHPYR
jgi:hypothetical protein